MMRLLKYLQARSYTMSMPYRVQKIEEFTNQLETGDLKLRVRVLEVSKLMTQFEEEVDGYADFLNLIWQSERAARKATILQMATMYTVFGGTLLNLGVTLSSQGNGAIANGSFIGAGVFMTLFLRSMQRAKKLEKFEKMI
ncbi:hypothetical protein Ahy_B07g088924 isoform G [Arachis hypogaea]|uniref:Uncharacterized protein n=1 Tax=Arachis hypogaea TaxID=3818 RepID=A0A444YFV1_ARAHY|nr:hypothetical protein Ahy_B07g088924 isoform G [Arachis hypogaea]